MSKNKAITVKKTVNLSTIKTMESFGEIGGEVLIDHGVEKVNEDDDYPYELRNELHRAILDRFGEIALTAFGFNHAESFAGQGITNSEKSEEKML